jgi:hypothetical protein
MWIPLRWTILITAEKQFHETDLKINEGIMMG